MYLLRSLVLAALSKNAIRKQSYFFSNYHFKFRYILIAYKQLRHIYLFSFFSEGGTLAKVAYIPIGNEEGIKVNHINTNRITIHALMRFL